MIQIENKLYLHYDFEEINGERLNTCVYSNIQKRNTAPPFSTVNSLNGALYPKAGSPVYVTLTETPESEWRYSAESWSV